MSKSTKKSLGTVKLNSGKDILAQAKKKVAENYDNNKEMAVCRALERTQEIDEAMAELAKNKDNLAELVGDLQEADTLKLVKTTYDKIMEFNIYTGLNI